MTAVFDTGSPLHQLSLLSVQSY